MIFLLVIMTKLFAFSNDFKLINDRAPLEFSLMFESLKLVQMPNEEKLRLVVACQNINNSLQRFSPLEVKSFLKTETTKGVLEFKLLNTLGTPPTTHQFSRIEKKIKEDSALYSPFARWLIRSLIADYQAFIDQGFLTKKINEIKKLSGAQGESGVKYQRVLKYTSPWLHKIEGTSPQEFNKLLTQVSWHVLDRIKEKSDLINSFSPKDSSLVSQTFNIPSMEELYEKPKKNDKKSQLNEISEEEKEAALELIQETPTNTEINPEEASEVIDQKMNDLDDAKPK